MQASIHPKIGRRGQNLSPKEVVCDMPLFSRHDGDRVKDLARTRAIMPFIMKGRNESLVFFEQELDLSRTLPWLAARSERLEQRATLFPLVVAATVQTLHERPRLNRFVSGQRIYQRKQIELSFAAKTALDDDHPIATIKRAFEPGQPLEDVVKALRGDIRTARSGAESAVDKELKFFLALPRPLLALGVKLLRWLDFHNLAPTFLLKDDPMYCSVFLANLGSIGLDAAFHHLYEYGNCSLFCVIGKTHQALRVVDGRAQVRSVATLRWTLDERIEDGLYCARALERFREMMENPADWLGAP